MNINIQDYLTLTDYAKQINIDRAAVYRRIVANRIPAIRIGSAWFVHKNTNYYQPLDAQYDNSTVVPYMLLSDYAKQINMSFPYVSMLSSRNLISGVVKIGKYVLVPNNAKILKDNESNSDRVNLNNYIGTYRFANKTNQNPDYIRSLVRTNKVPGVIKHNNRWLIPKSTTMADIKK